MDSIGGIGMARSLRPVVVVLAALLVIEFPGSASGSVRRTAARTAPGSLDGGALVASIDDRITAVPTAPLGRLG